MIKPDVQMSVADGGFVLAIAYNSETANMSCFMRSRFDPLLEYDTGS